MKPIPLTETQMAELFRLREENAELQERLAKALGLLNAESQIEAELNLRTLKQQLTTAQQQNAKLREALENCRLLAARKRKEEWASHVLRFCIESGVVGSPIRDTDLLDEALAEGGEK